MNACNTSTLPVYFMSILLEPEGYVAYVCKDTGRKKKVSQPFKTYAEAKAFCHQHSPTFKIIKL